MTSLFPPFSCKSKHPQIRWTMNEVIILRQLTKRSGKTVLLSFYFVSSEDRKRQVEGFGRAGCQFEFSVMWLHSVVYELFVEPVMTKECVPSDATSSF